MFFRKGQGVDNIIREISKWYFCKCKHFSIHETTCYFNVDSFLYSERFNTVGITLVKIVQSFNFVVGICISDSSFTAFY